MSWMTKMLSKSETSKEKAKKRLKLVLMHDRACLNPQILEKIKSDLLDVIARYVDIDRGGCEIRLDENRRMVALVANIPVKGPRKEPVC